MALLRSFNIGKVPNPWAIIPWYGVAAVLIIVFGNLRGKGG